MHHCDTCGNEYEQVFELVLPNGRSYFFDSFECAIHQLAPRCDACGCRIIGHGVQSNDLYYCSAHCARVRGVTGLETHVVSH